MSDALNPEPVIASVVVPNKPVSVPEVGVIEIEGAATVRLVVAVFALLSVTDRVYVLGR